MAQPPPARGQPCLAVCRPAPRWPRFRDQGGQCGPGPVVEVAPGPLCARPPRVDAAEDVGPPGRGMDLPRLRRGGPPDVGDQGEGACTVWATSSHVTAGLGLGGSWRAGSLSHTRSHQSTATVWGLPAAVSPSKRVKRPSGRRCQQAGGLPQRSTRPCRVGRPSAAPVLPHGRQVPAPCVGAAGAAGVRPGLHWDLLHEVALEARRVAGGWEQGHPPRMPAPPPPCRLPLRPPLHHPARPPWASDRRQLPDHGAAGPGAEINLQACFAAPMAPPRGWGGFSPFPPPSSAGATGAPLSPPSWRGTPGLPPPSAAVLRGRGTAHRADAHGVGQCHVPAPALAHGCRVARGRGADLRDPPHGGCATSNACPG